MAIGPLGSLLAAAGAAGVRLWHLPDGREVAHLPLSNSGTALFHPRDGTLFKLRAAGLLHWPVRGDRRGARGRPAPADDCRAHGPLLLVLSVALSRDGRWTATGGPSGTGVWVWDRATGRALARLPSGRAGAVNGRVEFSLDGRWLAADLQVEYRLWQAGTWELRRTIARDCLEPMPGPIAFSRDGRLMAIAPSARTIQPTETAMCRAPASLTAPESHVIRCLCFSPDGGRLVVATDAPAFEVWDLREVRRHLAAMRLDWGPPPLPPPRE